MADLEPISNLTAGSTKATDIYPAVDTTDTTQAPSGTTKKYTVSQLYNYTLNELGLANKTSARVATTANLTATYANGASGVGATLTNSGAQIALTIDAVALSVSDRVLVKNQSSGAQNGIYSVTNIGSGATNWVLTRVTDYDTSAEITYGSTLLVTSGTTNNNTSWIATFTGTLTVGSTTITFSTLSLGVPPYASFSGSYSLGGIAYSTASSLSVLAATVTANQVLLSGSSAAPSWSTATYPTTVTSGRLLYASGTNVISDLTTTARSVLTGNATSIPSWIALADGQIVIGSTAGTPSAATLTAGVNISIANASNAITISGNLSTYTAVSSSPYVVLTTDYYLGVSTASARTVQLPNAPTTGRTFVVKDSSGNALINNITITTVGGVVNIDGATSRALNTNYSSVSLLFNGTSYEVY